MTMDTYFTLRTIFAIVAVIFFALAIIYGVRVHIFKSIERRFGILERRELARMSDGRRGSTKKTTGRTTGRTTGSVTGSGKPHTEQVVKSRVDVSHVKTEKLDQQPMAAFDTEATAVIGADINMTTVLGQEEESQETVVLNDGVPMRPTFYMEKNIIVVHGTDI